MIKKLKVSIVKDRWFLQSTSKKWDWNETQMIIAKSINRIEEINSKLR